jgi:radical SAM protein with 4Fe4S-binding SPASM domain
MPRTPLDPGQRCLVPSTQLAHFEAKAGLLLSEDPADWERMPFPLELALELAAACNLQCIMCPVPTTTRPAELMADALFRQVIDEVAGMQGFFLYPQGFGEPLLHPRWAELLAYCRDQGVGPAILLTNAVLLGDENIRSLLALDLEAVVVSIDGVEPETYAKVRVGGDLRVVEANVRRFLELRGRAEGPRLFLRIIRMRETEAELARFTERWQPLLGPRDAIHSNEFIDWAGKVEDRSIEPPAPPEERRPCRMLWKNLSVHADGKVSACCLDSEDELIVGDLGRGQTLEEIWRGKELARLRSLHRAGRFAELPICLKCNSWK